MAMKHKNRLGDTGSAETGIWTLENVVKPLHNRDFIYLNIFYFKTGKINKTYTRRRKIYIICTKNLYLGRSGQTLA